MSRSPTIDAARLELMLTELRLPAMKAMWPDIAAQSDKEGWPASRFLAVLAEHEMADRSRRRIARHLAGSGLPDGKTVDSFEFELVPMVSKAQVKALIAGDSWLRSGANLVLRMLPSFKEGSLSTNPWSENYPGDARKHRWRRRSGRRRVLVRLLATAT